MTGHECGGGDCCASPTVTGGTFTQGPNPDDNSTQSFEASVSSFRLDQYEVTVARFRQFAKTFDAWVAAGNPVAGAGANPHIPGSGWQYGSPLADSADKLVALLACQSNYATYSDTGNDTLPLNCVDWYSAFAFCIWDGGRLPTESEWEYAAARGALATTYPWGNTPVPDDTLNSANLAVSLDDAPTDHLPVGARPPDVGLFGQHDLAGSMGEWVLDYYATYPTSPVTDYANLSSGFSLTRGGDWFAGAFMLDVKYRNWTNSDREIYTGVRCARDP